MTPDQNLSPGKYSCVVVQTPKGCEATMHLDVIPSIRGSPEGKYFGMPHVIVYTNDFRHPGELINTINNELKDRKLTLAEIIELLEKNKKFMVDSRTRALIE